MRIFRSVGERLRNGGSKRHVTERTPLEKAIQWIKDHRIPEGGILPHHKHNIATQEVTGYLIPTLYNLGEKELAKDLARWEASIQRPDGAFTATDNVPYTFDTAQVMRGLLTVLDEMPQVENNLRRACDFVASQITADGKVCTPSYNMWKCVDGSSFSEYANLYVLPPLLEAGHKLSEPRYIEGAKRGTAYFKGKPDLIEFKAEIGTFSHIFGYMMEALVDLDERELARKGLQQVASIQRESGAIPAYPGVDWVCSTGIAQLAVAWYKLGELEPADKAIAYLESIQHESGGFYGSYGGGAQYFLKKEISWVVKFFLDGLLLKSKKDYREAL